MSETDENDYEHDGSDLPEPTGTPTAEMARKLADPLWRLNNLYKIKDKSGKVVTFKMNWAQRRLYDEMWYFNCILKARQLGFCLDPATRVLTADLRWVAIADLNPGDKVVAVDEYPEKPGKGQQRKMRTADVQGVVTVERESYRITFDDGTSVICTGKHPWLSASPSNQFIKWRSIENDNKCKLRVGSKIRRICPTWGAGDYEDGWFGGMLDGEGSIAKPNTRASCNVSQSRGAVFDRLEAYCQREGYNYKIESDKNPERESKFGNKPTPKIVFNRMFDMFKLIGKTRPSRFVGNYFWEGRELPHGPDDETSPWVTITKIESLGVRKLIDLQTSTGTYIAEGLVSHNTTFIQIFILDRCLFEDNTQAAVIAHNLDDAVAFFYDKIKFAYDELPEEVRAWRPYTARSAREMIFSNGSRIRVGTSARSGTIHYLHVSEFGKICAKYPANAKEIVNGSIPAVPMGGFLFIESTAEGNKGYFHDIARRAEKLTKAVNAGKALMTKRDFKFHFFPWYESPEYAIDQRNIQIDDDVQEYFEQFEAEHGVHIDRAHRLFYQIEQARLQEDIKQEYPGTPDEAFEKLLKGSIFAVQIKKARAEDRFTHLPIEPGVRVNTFWDLGRNDMQAIWFHQRVGAWDHFIKYYEHRLVDMTHYLGVLEDFQHEHNWIYGSHYLPHDGRNKTVTSLDGSAKDIMENAGYRPVVLVERPVIKRHSIDSARKAFARCRFDVEGCEAGIEALENYQWIWDEDHSTFRKEPLHNWASNGADAFQQFGLGYEGDRSTFRQQLGQAVDGGSGRKYSRGRRVHNPLTNPSNSHLT